MPLFAGNAIAMGKWAIKRFHAARSYYDSNYGTYLSKSMTGQQIFNNT
jgi:hypothetical protein